MAIKRQLCVGLWRKKDLPHACNHTVAYLFSKAFFSVTWTVGHIRVWV